MHIATPFPRSSPLCAEPLAAPRPKPEAPDARILARLSRRNVDVVPKGAGPERSPATI
ncbi:hypothetical protein [Paracoccus cavernae]|uniref:hypothetical protein n=1 Tax=Paracoccus cavernae TaxID=1571207 RepID=UPI003605C10C